MTKLRYHHAPRWRETEVIVRDRRIRVVVVALQPSHLVLRLKGTRGTLTLPYSTAYTIAARLEADRRRAERKTRKRGAG